MVDYKCKTIPISKLAVGVDGLMTPLCDKCKTKDCTNPIEKRKISIYGVTKEVRVMSRGSDVSFVVNCIGYAE